ncbi:MAG: hypothetical protein K6E50_15175 [Lachnospiraceae bacterium]|nr:hypothetical protein [Lachnospiraceae bacterium]
MSRFLLFRGAMVYNASMDPITAIKIVVLAAFVLVIILRTMGPTKNKAAIDRSLEYLGERLTPPKRPYVPDPLLYERFKADCTDPGLLAELASGIVRHCGMEPRNLRVVTVSDRELQDAAGTYRSDGENSLISIRVTPSSRPNILHSVLIHECMHYFLFRSGIRREERRENEILTDVATVYMGFYQYMFDGYIMVGYLRDSELKYVKEKMDNTYF